MVLNASTKLTHVCKATGNSSLNTEESASLNLGQSFQR